MKFDFDTVTDRKNTNAIKYDLAEERGKPKDALSLWVADMDFPTAPCINEAIAQKAAHGIYGYSRPDNRYYQAVEKWFRERQGYEIKKEWIVNTPGVVFAISAAIRAYTQEGEGVLIQKPVYYPFFNMIKTLGRKVVNNPLVLKNGRYEIDFDDFESKIISEKIRLFIFCSPHNPGGRVWTKGELEKLAEICVRHNVIVVSDEIHSDIVFDGAEHTVFANISPEAEKLSVICTSPSKTFNLAGLQFSNIFIADEELRLKFKKEIDKTGYDEPALIGLVAVTAAYSDGGEWFDEAKKYIWKNIQFTKDFFEKKCPSVKVVVPEGSYLVWLDFCGTGFSDKEINDRVLNKAKVWLDNGTMFGVEGEKFQRINCATPFVILEEALNRIASQF